MARLLLKGTEAALGTDTAGANAFSSARLVRLVNVNGSSTYLVSLVATVGGSVVGTFTIPPHTVVELEKVGSTSSIVESTILIFQAGL